MATRLSNLPVAWRLSAPALGALVGLVLVAVATFTSLSLLREADYWDRHTREVLLHSRAQEGAFLAMLSALDRYVIGGDPSFLVAYEAATQRMEDEHRLVQALVADNPPQLARQERRRALIAAWQAEIAEPVLHAPPSDRLAVFRLDRARELTDALQAERQAFNAVQEEMQVQRRAAAEQALQLAVVMVGVALIAELALVVLTTGTVPLARPPAKSGAIGDQILVVENDAGFARLLEAELTTHGLGVVWASSAETALEELEVVRPRGVFLDLMLPGMHGEVFLQRLRKTADGEVPVVVITMKDLDVGTRDCLSELGVVGMLQKGPGVVSSVVDLLLKALPGQPNGGG